MVVVELIKTRKAGERLVYGTLYPVRDELYRHEVAGKVSWAIEIGVCNGNIWDMKFFSTFEDALAAWEA